MPETKKRIRKVVADYAKLFPEEYALLLKAVEMKRQLNRDQFATVEGLFDGRVLYEISETLHAMLVQHLTEEDMVWLKSGGLNHKEGGRWFAKSFPQFAIPAKI